MTELPLRDRLTIVLSLLGLAAVSWLYVIWQLAPMQGMAEAAPYVAFGPWSAGDFALNLAIWWVMMPGMMLPGAMGMILIFAAINRQKRARGRPFVPTAVFTAGYLVAWGVFGVVATVADWALEQAALLSPLTAALTPRLGAAAIIAAGLYQLTPLKYVCLTHCRSPFDFVLHHWRDGAAGALRMGWEHGLYCLGCCWLLMALLFAAGMMNLLAMAAVTAFVLAEKLLPAGQWVARLGGVLLIVLGGYLLVR
jgi:predicted metal-binding membrane protein